MLCGSYQFSPIWAHPCFYPIFWPLCEQILVIKLWLGHSGFKYTDWFLRTEVLHKNVATVKTITISTAQNIEYAEHFFKGCNLILLETVNIKSLRKTKRISSLLPSPWSFNALLSSLNSSSSKVTFGQNPNPSFDVVFFQTIWFWLFFVLNLKLKLIC